ncbi:MAG: GNAT family N-acetyltransferase [Cyclobacteriaceae bacterium]|jgi:hypothetical protein
MEIKSYQIGDEVKIERLFTETFGKKMPTGFWKWRYQCNPFLKDVLIHLMWDEDNLVGHYALSPIEMSYNHRPILTALSMTTMTSPSYSGRGIFKSLAESVYSAAVDKYGIKAVWGFPNANSHYGFIKNLSWSNLGSIPFLSLKIKEEELKHSTVNYTITKIFSSNKAKTLMSNDEPYNIRINKTQQYLQWRYLENPAFEYKILELEVDSVKDFIVFKIIKSFSIPTFFEADIVEWGGVKSDSIHEVIKALISYSVLLGTPIKKVNTWLSLFTTQHLVLEKAGFILDSPVTYMGVRTLGDKLPDFHSLKSWEIGMGYSDVF